jgi:hypothetical protein
MWLESYDVQYNELWFSRNKGLDIQDFNRMYPSRPVLALIDDIPANFDQLTDGVIGIAWDQQWNQGYFPRMQYNEERMQIEFKTDTVSDYIPWRK